MGLLRCVPPFSAGPRVAGLIGRLEDLLGASGYLWYADDLNPNWITESDDPSSGAPWAVSAGIAITISQSDPDGGSKAFNAVRDGAGNSKNISQVVANPVAGLLWSYQFSVMPLDSQSDSAKVQVGFLDGGFTNTTGTVVSGTGSFTGTGLLTLTGLTEGAWTTVRITTDAAPTTVNPYIYPGGSGTTAAEQRFFRPTVQVYHDGYDTGQLHQTGATAGGLVASWADRIQSLAAVQATASKQPYVRWNQGTGRLEVVFDGTDDRLLTAAFSGGAIAQPTSVYTVVLKDDGANSFVFDGVAATRNALLERPTGEYHAFAGSNVISVATWDLTNQLLSINYNGSSSSLRRNGTEIASGDVGAQAMGAVSMAASNTDTLHGRIDLALLAIDPTGDTAKRAQIETIINQLYNDIYTQLYDDNGDPLLDDLNNVLRED